MIVENGKIIEATTNELFHLYLEREMDLIMSFPDYVEAMKLEGCKVITSGGQMQ